MLTYWQIGSLFLKTVGDVVFHCPGEKGLSDLISLEAQGHLRPENPINHTVYIILS